MIVSLPLPPSANACYRVSGKRMVKTPEFREWLDDAADKVAANGWDSVRHCRVSIRVYGMDFRRDLDNTIKPILDALQAGGLLENDRWVVGIDIRRFPPTKDGWRHVIVEVQPEGWYQ